MPQTKEDKEERVQALAAMSGVPVPADLAAEVGDRLASVLSEMEKLTALDLDGIEPVVVFPEENADGR